MELKRFKIGPEVYPKTNKQELKKERRDGTFSWLASVKFIKLPESCIVLPLFPHVKGQIVEKNWNARWKNRS